ncbi:riboflavin synthase alpha chain [Ramicandelaber brevisporus]|nr:riboflavin synthase alpha chain [Ramicandelaber brevisporus]
MFTGIVELIATVESLTLAPDGHTILKISNAGPVLGDCHIGDSIAVDGVCLTVTAFNATENGGWWTSGLAPETLRRSSLGELQAGSRVNLERAVAAASGRLGGHMVQGHIDGTVKIRSITPDGAAAWIRFDVPPAEESHGVDLLRYIVPKGFITLDGASLTVCEVDDRDRMFSVMLVPHTQENITMMTKGNGALVNVEVDLVGKYVEKILAGLVSPNSKDAGQENDSFSNYVAKVVRNVLKEEGVIPK